MAWSLDRAAVVQVERVLARDLDAMPLADALARGLGVQSWMLVVGADGRWRALTVLEARVTRPVPAPAPAPPEPADPLVRRYILPPRGVLVKVVGAPFATGRQLADVALHHDDPELRAEAVRVGVDAAMADPGRGGAPAARAEPARARALRAALALIDDATLAAGLAGAAGDAAPALVSVVAERARGRALGERAARVLEHLGPP